MDDPLLGVGVVALDDAVRDPAAVLLVLVTLTSVRGDDRAIVGRESPGPLAICTGVEHSLGHRLPFHVVYVTNMRVIAPVVWQTAVP